MGSWLESGTYTVELLHSVGLASFATEVTMSDAVSFPQELTFTVETAQRGVDGQLVHLVNLYNPTAESVSLADTTACWLEISVNDVHPWCHCCTGSVSNLMPGEVMLVDQFGCFRHPRSRFRRPVIRLCSTAPRRQRPAASPSLEMELVVAATNCLHTARAKCWSAKCF